MKKKLLAFLTVLYCFLIHAQDKEYQIELIGIGVKGKASETLTISDTESVDKINLFAVSKGMYSTPPANGVLFDNNDTPSSEWTPITGDEYLSPSNDASVGYYHREINSESDHEFKTQLNASISTPDNIHSFYSYVFRSNPTSAFRSYLNETHTFMYLNGSDNAYVYEIKIDQASKDRDVKLKIPVSELDNGPRMMVIDVVAGPISSRFVDNTYNLDNSLLIKEYVLENVPGYVGKIEVSIFSPTDTDPDPTGNGDSFFVGGVLANVDKVFDGCTHTQGYWKTHSSCKENGNGNGKGPERDDTWDKLPEGEETEFFLSGQNYCEVFDTKPGKGGKYYILAHQYIAAQLNILDMADPKDIADEFNEATAFLNMYTPDDVNANPQLQAKCVELGGVLDDFNNGRIGPGHCDDVAELTVDPIKRKIDKSKIRIYPNPVADYGKIVFRAGQAGPTLVEVYNLNGQKMGTLFDGSAKKSDQIEIEFNVLQLKEGIYFVLIKNGTSTYREKLSVLR